MTPDPLTELPPLETLPDTLDSLDRNDLAALLEAYDELNRVKSFQEVLRSILQLAGRMIDSPAGSVLLHDPRRNDLYFAASTGPAAQNIENLRVPVNKSKAGSVFLSGKPLVEDNLGEHYDRIDQKGGFDSRSMICIPLIQGERVIGVMQMLNKAEGTAAYTGRDLQLLMRFGVQASLCIRNAALFEQMVGSSGLHSRDEERVDIVGHLLSPLPFGFRERMTILAVDMRGFSRFCAGLGGAGRIQEMLNEYVALIASIVVHHHGILNKVIGDGIVAFFRKGEGPSHAIRAAFAMLDHFAEFRERWGNRTNFGLDFLDLGIGIASDEDMILGTVGDEQFRDVTLIGQGVNLASALVDTARDGKRIRCDKLTWLAAGSLPGISAGPPGVFESPKLPSLTGVNVYDLSRELAEVVPVAGMAPAACEFDVFISYRRSGGSGEARTIQQALKDEFRVFLDVDRMPSGHFDESLLRIIADSPNFIVILSPGALDRVHESEDWMRREIAHALRTQRKVIPVVLPGFRFPHPHSLPEEIREIVRHDAVEYSHRYFYPSMEKLREHLRDV